MLLRVQFLPILFVRKEVLKSGRLRKPERRGGRITQEESTFSNGGRKPAV